MNAKRRRKLALLRLILTGVLLVTLVLLAAYVIVRSEGSSLNGIVRDISAFVTNKSEITGMTITYEDEERCAALGTNMAYVNSDGIEVYDRYGTQIFSAEEAFSQPAVESAGGYAVAYDIGGYAVRLFKADKMVFELDTQKRISDVSLNKNGWFSVCTEDEQYRGIVTVYRPSGAEAYRWYSADGYVMAAVLSDDNSMLAALTVASDGSSIARLRLDDENLQGEYTLPDEVILDISMQPDGGVVGISQNRVLAVDTSGNLKYEYIAENARISLYAFSDNGSVLIEESGYASGQDARLVFVGTGGETASCDVTENAVAAALSNGRIAVCFDGRLVFYGADMSELSAFDIEEGVKTVVIRSDGAAVAVFEDAMRVYK